MQPRVALLIILNIFLFLACQKEKTHKNKVEKKKHPEKNIKFKPEKDWKISAKGIGFIELGNSLSKTALVLSEKYTVERTFMNTYNIYKNGEKILYLVPIENTDIIRSIRILKNNWESESGLKIGMSINEINIFYEKFYLEYDASKINEYFPEYGNFKKNNKNINSITKFYFSGNFYDYIGEYNFNNTKKSIYKSKKNYGKAKIFMVDIEIIQ